MFLLLSYSLFIKYVRHFTFPAIAPPLLGCYFSYFIHCLLNLFLTPLFLLLPLPFLVVPSLILSNAYKICSSLHLSCYCPSSSWMLLLLFYSLFIKSVPHSPFLAIAPPLLVLASLILSNVYKTCSKLHLSCNCPSSSWMLLLLFYSLFIKYVSHSPFPNILPPLLACSFFYLIHCL